MIAATHRDSTPQLTSSSSTRDNHGPSSNRAASPTESINSVSSKTSSQRRSAPSNASQRSDQSMHFSPPPTSINRGPQQSSHGQVKMSKQTSIRPDSRQHHHMYHQQNQQTSCPPSAQQSHYPSSHDTQNYHSSQRYQGNTRQPAYPTPSSHQSRGDHRSPAPNGGLTRCMPPPFESITAELDMAANEHEGNPANKSLQQKKQTKDEISARMMSPEATNEKRHYSSSCDQSQRPNHHGRRYGSPQDAFPYSHDQMQEPYHPQQNHQQFFSQQPQQSYHQQPQGSTGRQPHQAHYSQQSHQPTHYWSSPPRQYMKQSPQSQSNASISVQQRPSPVTGNTNRDMDSSSQRKRQLDIDSLIMPSPPPKKNRQSRHGGAWTKPNASNIGNNCEDNEISIDIGPSHDSIDCLVLPSPFHSPAPSPNKGSRTPCKKLDCSPLFSEFTPNGGQFSGFVMGVDTPVGLSFSPMGHNLGANANLGFTIENGGIDSRGDEVSGGRGSPIFHKRRSPNKRTPPSPFSTFLRQGSPLSKSYHQRNGHGSVIGGPPPENPSSVHKYHRESNRGRAKSSGPSCRTSGNAPSRYSPYTHHEDHPANQNRTKRRYPDNGVRSASPTPLIRLKLGTVNQTETRKGMEGINSALRGSPLTRREGGMAGAPPSYNSSSHIKQHTSPPFISSMDHRTPMGPGMGMNSSNGTPSSYHGSVGSGRPVLVTASHFPNLSGNYPSTAVTPSKNAPGKENESKSHRQNPCNCKKSKCLKLYCECFAAERFCSGCNCQDCNNIPEYEAVRNEAIKATRAKNPNAFKPRFEHKQSGGTITCNPATGHNMGCRCKRSACLKKYCECFEAGVMCGDKCKCVECQNFIGSQALIDRRRKIKDHRGAEIAMRSADVAWKGGRRDGKHGHKNPGSSPNIPGRKPIPGGPTPMPHTMGHSMNMHRMNDRSSQGSNAPPHFMPPHMMVAPSPGMGYPPMGIHPVTPAYPSGKQSASHRFDSQSSGSRGTSTHMPPRTPLMSTPHTPAVRLGFDAFSSKKARNVGPGSKEPTKPVFGRKLPEQPKTTALSVFSFLSNDDLYNASLVSKMWSSLSLDEELWKF